MAVVQISGETVLVDDEDLERVLAAGPWCLKGLTYANRTRYVRRDAEGSRKHGRKTIYLHRFLLNAPTGVAVDHINGNGLDNRKSNLRLCSAGENKRNSKKYSNNTSGYKGVFYRKESGRFRAMIRLDGKLRHLGTFDTAQEAHAAYCAAALELHGSFANLE